MDLEKVIKQIKAQKARKFDESVELVFAVTLPKGSDATVRMDLNIPHQFGESKKVLVLCDKSEEADAKGADFVGLEEYVEKIKGGWKEFDVVIATPTVMPKIAILGKFLGSSGLMPNPKNGTVTKELDTAVAAFKSGKMNLKASKSGQIQFAAGKKSMDNSTLLENVEYVVKTVSDLLSKEYNASIKSLYVKTSMGTPYRLL